MGWTRDELDMCWLQLRDLRHENVNPFVGFFVDTVHPALGRNSKCHEEVSDTVHPALVYEYCTRRSLMVRLVTSS